MATSSKLLVLAAALMAYLPARAAEVTRVMSGDGEGAWPEVAVSMAWLHESGSAAIKRELGSSLSDSGLTAVRDLRYSHTRDLLAFRADVGAIWDLSFHLEAPLVLADSRRLDFDRGGDCLSASGVPAGCDQTTSSLLRDGILPGYGQSSYGLDATNRGQAFSSPSGTVFRGPSRSGLEYLGVGLTWAVMRQDRDESRPTWSLSFDARLSLGGPMRFDPDNPAANTSVGLGYHQLVWSTWISERIRYFEPYLGAWYMLPVRTSDGPFGSSTPGTQPALGPQQRLGVSFGFEHVAWEEPERHHRLSLELRGRGELVMRGRNYSEIWEPLSGPSGCSTDATRCRSGLDLPLPGETAGRPFSGVTEIEGYASFGADAAVNLRLGRYVRLRALAGLTVVQPHAITDAGAGKDLDGNGKVDTLAETNTSYRQIIDQPGRRFRVDESRAWNLLLDVAVSY